MRLDIPIDDNLVQQALQMTGLSTKQAVIEEALRLLILSKKSRSVELNAGKLQISENKEQQILLAEMATIAERCAALPDLDTRSESEILGYNQQGLLINGN